MSPMANFNPDSRSYNMLPTLLTGHTILGPLVINNSLKQYDILLTQCQKAVVKHSVSQLGI